MNAPSRVVVIGGGVVGLACAHHLQQAGWKVTVIDRQGIGQACSRGNCGLICPSHVLPLAEPGALRMALVSLVNPRSPFRVKPRLDASLWSWMWHFARRCNHADMINAGRGIQPLLDSSLQLYEQLVSSDGVACEWERQGLLFVYRTPKAFEAYAETDALLAELFHAPAKKLNSDELADFEPALLPGLAGGWYYDHDAHLRPDRLMSSWKDLLTSRGVTFREGCELQGFIRDPSVATAVQTSQGPVAAEAFVVATGALTPLLAEHLGCAIPIQPGKGYSLTMPRPTICPKRPLMFPEHRVAVTPMASGYRLGSIMEFVGYDDSIQPHRLALLTDGAKQYLREPAAEPVQERWTGWRPMTWDSLPIIDRRPAATNVFVAAGHNMLGLSMAPATGRLIAELVTGQPPHLDPRPYRLARFA